MNKNFLSFDVEGKKKIEEKRKSNSVVENNESFLSSKYSVLRSCV